jgi:hypothetical protein
MSEETKKAIKDMLDAIGATCELIGYLRKQLMANGFSRKESLMMCTEVLLAMLTPGDNDND